MKDESGAISLFLAVIFLAFLLIAGMVMDSAALRSERRAAADMARQAARAAVQEVDVAHYRVTGRVRLKQEAAKSAAEAAVTNDQYKVEVSTKTDRALVKVSREVPAQLLGLSGELRTLSASHEARAVKGVSYG